MGCSSPCTIKVSRLLSRFTGRLFERGSSLYNKRPLLMLKPVQEVLTPTTPQLPHTQKFKLLQI